VLTVVVDHLADRPDLDVLGVVDGRPRGDGRVVDSVSRIWFPIAHSTRIRSRHDGHRRVLGNPLPKKLGIGEGNTVALPAAPPEFATALGALLDHITGGHIVTEDEPREDASPRARSFQPMNINYGLLPPLDETPTMSADGKRLKGPERGLAKKKLQSQRALADLANWLGASGKSAAAE